MFCFSKCNCCTIRRYFFVDHREFVGKICYGVVYDLWNPTENLRFGNGFRRLALILFACQRRIESPLCYLPDDCIFYILNMCRWDWVDDSYEGVRDHKKKVRSRLLALDASKRNSGLDGNDTEMDDSVNVATAAAAAAAVTSSAVSKTCCDMKDVQEEDVKMTASNEDAKVRAMDDDDDDDDNYNENMEEDEYDEDYEEEDDDDESEGSGEDEWGHSIGSFRYNVYDDYESTSDQEARENARLREEREARRRWMMRLHLLQNWGGMGEQVFFVNANDEDDDDDSEE